MKNFAIRFSMKCTEKQWKDSGIQKQLEAIGYNFSELVFYPNKDFVCTFYKDHKDRISTTNKPFEKGRQVLDEWNPDLFVALCSQHEGSSIMVGEWFTDKGSGNCHLCTTISGNYVGYTVPGSKSSPAFKLEQVSKSTYYELCAYVMDRDQELIGDFEEVRVTVKPEALAKRKEEIGVVINSEESSPLKIVHEAEKKPVQIDIQTEEPIKSISLDSFVIDDIEKLVKPKTLVDVAKIVSAIDIGLTLDQITQAFKDKKRLTVGRVTENEIQCQEANIEWISHTHVKFHFNEAIKHDQLFLSREAFLLYALKQLSPSKK